jgi:hypothetical protein
MTQLKTFKIFLKLNIKRITQWIPTCKWWAWILHRIKDRIISNNNKIIQKDQIKAQEPEELPNLREGTRMHRIKTNIEVEAVELLNKTPLVSIWVAALCRTLTRFNRSSHNSNRWCKCKMILNNNNLITNLTTQITKLQGHQAHPITLSVDKSSKQNTSRSINSSSKCTHLQTGFCQITKIIIRIGLQGKINNSFCKSNNSSSSYSSTTTTCGPWATARTVICKDTSHRT